MLDRRLHRIISNVAAPYQYLLINPNFPQPRDEPPVLEPASLDFLDIISGFHNGDLLVPTIARTRSLYDVVLDRFLLLTSALIPITRSVLSQRATFDVDFIRLRDDHLVRRLYSDLNIPHGYPLINLFSRLYNVALTISASPHPVIQATTIASLPVELLRMISAYLQHDDLANLARANSHCYKVCMPWASVNFIVRFKLHPLGRPWNAHKGRALALRSLSRGELNSAHARDECLFLMSHFRTDPEWIFRVRRISIDNQRGDLLDLVQSSIFERGVVELVQSTSLSHLRLTALRFDIDLISAICAKDSLTHMTLEVCTPALRCFRNDGPRISSVTYLALGFNLTGSQQTWDILVLFPNVQHFYGYTAAPSAVIQLPTTTINSRGLTVIHRLRSLHLCGVAASLHDLAEWICYAGYNDARMYPVLPPDQAPDNLDYTRGTLSHVKIRTWDAIEDNDIRIFARTLAVHHPDIRVLALGGVLSATAAIEHISTFLPNLEGLTLTRYAHAHHASIGLCDWEEPVHVYAHMLAGMGRLRHFGANFPLTSTPLRPSDDLTLRLELEEFTKSMYATDAFRVMRFDCHRLNHPVHLPSSCCDDISIGTSLAAPFAVLCHSLTSFTIQSETILYACLIDRVSGAPQIYSIVDHATLASVEHWNPRSGESWSFLPHHHRIHNTDSDVTRRRRCRCICCHLRT